MSHGGGCDDNRGKHCEDCGRNGGIGECFDLDNFVVVVTVDTIHNTRKKIPFGCFAQKGCV